jgi:hypothetical protein
MVIMSDWWSYDVESNTQSLTWSDMPGGSRRIILLYEKKDEFFFTIIRKSLLKKAGKYKHRRYQQINILHTQIWNDDGPLNAL